MKSKLYINSTEVLVKTFSDGAVQITLDESNTVFTKYDRNFDNFILAHIKCSEGVLALCQLVDAVKHKAPSKDIQLHLPYVPYARYDRRMIENDSQSLKVFCNIINSLNFLKVSVLDPHSMVVENLLNNCYPIEQLSCLIDTLGPTLSSGTYTHLVAPDQGSIKKVEAAAKYFNLPYIRCGKSRAEDNSLSSIEVYDDIPLGSKLLVLDDIIDYSGSLSQLSSHLKTKDSTLTIDAYATHGILPFNTRISPPDRFNFVLEFIDNVYLYYLWSDGVLSDTRTGINFNKLF